MRTRALAVASFGCMFLGSLSIAHAAGAWLASAPITPVEQRVAVAAGPDRTTLWTSLRFTGPAATVGVVLPVPSGTSLDWSSDAWFEALESATAPRVLPPPGMLPTCFDWQDGGGIFELLGSLDHVASLPVASFDVLADAPAVRAWASGLGLVIPPSVDVALGAVDAALGGLGAARFAAMRFDAPAGGGITPTLRAVMPGATATLPLSLARAAGTPMQVTAYLVGSGRGELAGSTPVPIPADLTWDAVVGASDYAAERRGLLEEANAAITDASSHGAWVTPASSDGIPVDGVLDVFFERAVAYGHVDEGVDADACVALAGAAFASELPVAPSCPRADLGIVDGADACVEAPTSATTDPASLRCGALADDLAVALSGLVPSEAWLTRKSLLVEPGGTGSTYPVAFQDGAIVGAFVSTADVRYDDCGPAPTWDDEADDASGSVSGSAASGDGGGGGSSSSSHSGCDGSGAADGCEAGAEGAGACADALDGLGDLDCSMSARRPPRLSVIGLLLAAILAPLRRRGTSRRRCRERRGPREVAVLGVGLV